MNDIILSGLWRATWQSTILCVIVAVFVKLTPRISPAIHCWAWRLVCLKMVVAFFVASTIDLPLIPAAGVLNATATTESSSPMGSPAEISNLKSFDSKSADLPPDLPRNNPQHWPAMSWQNVLAGLWVIGVCYQLLRLVKDWRLVRHRLATAEVVEADNPNKILRSEVIDAEMSTCPKLLSGQSTDCPAIIGTLTPQLLIPQSVLDESDEGDLRMLIRHELAHIRRGDLWWNWLAAVTQLLFYFHPATWLVLKEWRMSQESACDELALRTRTEESADYASMLLAIAVAKDPSRSLTYATGVFESFETLKRRIENMAHFGTRSKLRIGLAYSFVGLTALGLLPWKVVSQDPTIAPAVVGGEIDNSATRKKVDGVWISVADAADVSNLKHEFRTDLSRLMNKIQPNIKTTKSSQQTKFANGGASASTFSAGGGGGVGSVTKFAGRPAVAIALTAETDRPAEVMILDKLIGTDEAGREYESLPTSSSSTMICPEYEKDNDASAIAYFPKSAAKVRQFAKLNGTILVSLVESDDVEFKRLRKGMKKKTKLGEYQITELEVDGDGTRIAVQFPLPMSVRKALSGQPRDVAAFQERVQARQMLPGMIRTEFIGSDGLIHKPQFKTSHGGSGGGGGSSGGGGGGSSGGGSGGQTSSFSTITGLNGTKTTSPGGFSSRKSGVIEYMHGFTNLPRNVKIVGLRIQVAEKPTATKEIPFELTNVKLK